jgi:hypothetical protein
MPARTLSSCHEGTPSIYSASLIPDIDHSVIDVGFHYQRGCDLDRQARGRLTNFTGWTAVADTGLDAAITAAAAAQGQRVNGNIGDRDTVGYDNGRYSLHEVQYRKGDFGTWRVYLHTWQTGSIGYLPITTHGGSTAFANPSVTAIRAPSGRPAVAVSLFLPSEGAAPGEGGPLIYYREYTVLPDPTAGVAATYFDNRDLTGSTLTRVEPRIDIDFGTGRPSPNLGADQFSVRWTGQVRADTSQTYRFYTQTDDGARLWIDGVQLVDDWTDHGIVENSGTIALSAGRHDLTMEFYDNGGGALARLLWSAAGTPKAVVPADHLSRPRTGLTGEYYAGITLTGPARTRPDGELQLGQRIRRSQRGRRTHQRAVDRPGHSPAQPDLPVLHQLRRRLPALGQQQAAGRQLGRPGPHRTQRHHHPDRRRAVRPAPGVLQPRRRGPGPAAVEQPVPGETDHPAGGAHPTRGSPAARGVNGRPGRRGVDTDVPMPPVVITRRPSCSVSPPSSVCRRRWPLARRYRVL